ncbi:MAG: RAD55 family ATPase, partial [Candidatus Hodarchaeota archaeon]
LKVFLCMMDKTYVFSLISLIALSIIYPLPSDVLMWAFLGTFVSGWAFALYAFIRIFNLELLKAGTRKEEPISEKDLKSFKEIRLGRLEKTGIKLLDDIFGGGIPSGYQTAIIYEEGTYPQLFGLHFLFEGLRNEQCCVYETTNRSPYRIKRDFIDFIMNRNREPSHEFFENMVIIDYFSPRYSFDEFGFRIGEEVDRDSPFRSRIEKADTRKIHEVHSLAHKIWDEFIKHKRRPDLIIRRVFDNISTLAETSDLDLVRQYLLHRIPIEGELSWNTFYLIKKGMSDPKFESFLLDLVDIVIELKWDEGKNRVLILKKLRNKPSRVKPVKYEINEELEIVETVD